MSEADVRAEIVDPLIRHLGYEFGKACYVQRERSLRYPYGFVGHKSKRDVPLGAADYICGLDGRRGSFSVEAKKGSHDITIEDIQQAHSYASHPEIRANFFVISNGHYFNIYETLRGTEADHLISVLYDELDERYYQIEGLLSPDKLEKYSTPQYDIGKPIAEGYGSAVRLTGGFARIEKYSIEFDAPDTHPIMQLLHSSGKMDEIEEYISNISQFDQPIADGSIGRNSSGRLFADIKFGSIHPKLQHNMMSMGLSEVTFFTDAEHIQGSVPTVFETLRIGRVPYGTELYPNLKEGLEAMQGETEFDFYANCIGTLTNNTFQGNFDGVCVYDIEFRSPVMFKFPRVTAKLVGNFEVSIER